MAVADETRITLYGSNMRGIPTNKSNLIYKVACKVFEAAGVKPPELTIAMHSDIPLTRGLGSSASAIVGALAAANALIGGPLSEDELFQMATRMEDHPDNVGASLFGGIVVAFWDGERAEYVRLDPDSRLTTLVAIPEFHLSTEKARHALPKQISMKDAVFNVSHSSVLVAAFSTGNLPMIRNAMKDRLHQPYRAALVPGMQKALEEADQHGALGIALSGAGPTLIAFADRETTDKAKLESFMIQTLLEAGVKARTMWLEPSREGVRIYRPGDSGYEGFDLIKGEVRA